MKQHPRIAVSLELDDRFVDIVSGGFDAVIRHGPVGDGRLVAHRLAPGGRLLIASPAYLTTHGEPRSLEGLEAHRAILYSHRETDWRFQAAGGVRVVRPTAGLRVNNGIFIRDAALAGLGIALVPSFIVSQELRSGALKALNIGYQPEAADLNIAYPRDRISSAKLLALMHHLRSAFGSPPYWEIPPAKEPG
jgi:DNA-binding transcriptional LysR family regulator